MLMYNIGFDESKWENDNKVMYHSKLPDVSLRIIGLPPSAWDDSRPSFDVALISNGKQVFITNVPIWDYPHSLINRVGNQLKIQLQQQIKSLDTIIKSIEGHASKIYF